MRSVLPPAKPAAWSLCRATRRPCSGCVRWSGQGTVTLPAIQGQGKGQKQERVPMQGQAQGQDQAHKLERRWEARQQQ